MRMRKFIIEEAKQLWFEGKGADAVTTLFSRIPLERHPLWGAALLRSVMNLSSDTKRYEKILEFIENVDEWKNIKTAFSFLDFEMRAISPIEAEIHDFTYNLIKLTYNVYIELYRIDYAAYYDLNVDARMGLCLNRLVWVIGENELREELWEAMLNCSLKK